MWRATFAERIARTVVGFLECGIPLGVTMAFLNTSPLVNEVTVVLQPPSGRQHRGNLAAQSHDHGSEGLALLIHGASRSQRPSRHPDHRSCNSGARTCMPNAPA